MDKWKATSIILMLLIVVSVVGYFGYNQVTGYQNEKKACAQNISELKLYSAQLKYDNALYAQVVTTCKTDAFIKCAQEVINNQTKG